MEKKRTKKVRITHLKRMKEDGRKIVAITAYDWSVASIVDECGVDVVLVGDSLGNVVQGLESTIPVRMSEMIYHTKNVARGIKTAHLCADMPFLSYQASDYDAVRNAGNLMKRGGAESVKIEVNATRYTKTVRALTDSGIPVIAHVGLCPQSVNMLGGYGVQGKTSESAQFIYDLALECAGEGAFALLLERVEPSLTEKITSAVDIPVIGIGSGGGCDGQVLVFDDMVGLTKGPLPGFVKKYSEARKIFSAATGEYIREVRKGVFPSPDGKKR
ncbi:MAG: 3-methyl-2-oxobutanoate hydroxymethyltransferase [Candidatus Mycalebacterium zealandia]|nr:MAG: 3-methyl-2-oxobutanoate hydroxymethyltransferase [Candidatus Mycalebacterium zealandia]